MFRPKSSTQLPDKDHRPELVQEQPYNHTADLWSLGIILYELYCGQPPFYTNNIYSRIQLIVQHDVAFPPNMSPPFKAFLGGLLCFHAMAALAGWVHFHHLAKKDDDGVHAWEYYWLSSLLSFLVAVSLWQILYLKSFFEVKRVV